jgi:hypothetical protein
MTHVSRDHDEVGKVDEHVLEENRILILRRLEGTEDSDVDADRYAELLARPIHVIEQPIVDGNPER